MKIIWSFSSGPPIYSSYQANINHEPNQENASGVGSSFFFDCGDDWELYIHTEHGKMVKFSELITPIMFLMFSFEVGNCNWLSQLVQKNLYPSCFLNHMYCLNILEV